MEQWTHKPLVLGSNPSLAIFNLNSNLGSGFPFCFATRTLQIPASPFFVYLLSKSDIVLFQLLRAEGQAGERSETDACLYCFTRLQPAAQ